MKYVVSFVFLFFSFFLYAQVKDTTFGLTPEYLKLIDTLRMDGAYLIGKPMHEFQVESISGHSYSTACLKNKITFINFWFEACTPCIAEIEALNVLYKFFKKEEEFQFLSFTFDKKQTVQKLKKKYKIKYDIISTTLDSCTLLNFRKPYPTTYILDRTGSVFYYIFGGPINPQEAKQNMIVKIYPIINKLLTNE